MEPLSERLKTVIDDCVDSISPVQQEVVDRSVEVLESVEAILGSDYDLDRLRELVEADRDGRVQIEPQKTNFTNGETPGKYSWLMARFMR